MNRIVFFVLLLLLAGCAGQGPLIDRQAGFTPRLQAQQLYVVPFETVMVPGEVSESLFDRFVDRLNERGAGQGYEFVILKQGLAEIDKGWLAERDYLLGELFAYVEDVGSTVTDIKASSRVRLYQAGQAEPTLVLAFPAESFYENDYSTLAEERRKIAQNISFTLADKLIEALSDR